MTRSGALGRKFIYLTVIVLMLVPLYMLGQPGTGAADAAAGGGALDRLRSEYDLGEAELGEIDPASESMRLATLGMRGVAATLLWQRADEYKRRQEWDRLSATLNTISRLQPYFENVWDHQAHNLAYNVSVEFDDYRQRYEWVKKGIVFLMRGVRQNRRQPVLVWNTGWYFGQKLGISDEKEQFRELFSDDVDFHEVVQQEGIDVDGPEARGPYGKPDNWLVGRLWMVRAYDLVDSGVPLLRKNPLHFFQDASLQRAHHAATIEREGVLDERAKDAWQRASGDFAEYGQRPIETYDGFTIRLGALAELERQLRQLRAEYEELAGDLPERIRAQREAELTDEEREMLAALESTRDENVARRAREIERRITPTPADVARALPPEQQLAALELVGRLQEVEQRTVKTNNYREQTNFVYWVQRAEAEQQDETIAARRAVYEAERLLDEAELEEALERYEQAWALWAGVFDRYPILAVDVEADDLVEAIRRYQRVLDQENLPDDFPLRAFLELQVDGASDPEDYVQRRRAETGRPQDENDDRAADDADAPADEDRAGAAENADGGEAPDRESPADDANADDAETPAEDPPAAEEDASAEDASAEGDAPVADEPPAADDAAA